MNSLPFFASLAVAATLLVTACSSETIITPAPAAAADADATAPLPAGDPAAFDKYCQIGGSPGTVGVVANAKDCALGYCVYDGRRELPRSDGNGTFNETYCTADCTKVGCPEAWECVPSLGGDVSVCVKEIAVCGDSRKQPDEACDDGNTYDRDGCSKDCKKVRGAGLVVESLVVGGAKVTPAVFTALPQDIEDVGGAALDAVSANALRIRFALAEPAAKSLVYEIEMPRSIGVVDVGATSAFYVAVRSRTTFIQQTKAPTLEVVSGGTDLRSYRVKFTTDADATAISGTFVVTLP